MSVNKHRPHVLVIPEDEANHDLANGFQLEVGNRQLQVLPYVGGWLHVVEELLKNHVGDMTKIPHRVVVLLIDFDHDSQEGGAAARLARVRERIPAGLQDRVFVLGSRRRPETLRAQLHPDPNTLEQIGRLLAEECRDGERTLWAHDELSNNESELAKLEQKVGPLLFG